MAWAWIRIGDDVMLGFTYDDPTAGPSAKGAFVHPDSFDDDVRRAVERPDHTVRLGHGVYTERSRRCGCRRMPSTRRSAATPACS